jgi:hypothetical protein
MYGKLRKIQKGKDREEATTSPLCLPLMMIPPETGDRKIKVYFWRAKCVDQTLRDWVSMLTTTRNRWPWTGRKFRSVHSFRDRSGSQMWRRFSSRGAPFFGPPFPSPMARHTHSLNRRLVARATLRRRRTLLVLLLLATLLLLVRVSVLDGLAVTLGEVSFVSHLGLDRRTIRLTGLGLRSAVRGTLGRVASTAAAAAVSLLVLVLHAVAAAATTVASTTAAAVAASTAITATTAAESATTASAAGASVRGLVNSDRASIEPILHQIYRP